MGSWDAAVMAMISLSAIGFLVADGEKKRLRWVQAMRHCLLRLNDIIRYEQLDVCALLKRIDLHSSQQERELSRLLHACAAHMEQSREAALLSVYMQESVRRSSYGVLSLEDRSPFESVLGELGCCSLCQQLRQIDEADERLRCREETLHREGAQRARLISTLGVCCGAAAFLVLI